MEIEGNGGTETCSKWYRVYKGTYTGTGLFAVEENLSETDDNPSVKSLLGRQKD